jgi:hypothetical protein
MVRVFQFDDGTCMHGGVCHGKCDIVICSVRTLENAWRSGNAMYGIMVRKNTFSRLPNIVVINTIKYDRLQMKDLLNCVSKRDVVYKDTDSEIVKLK